MSRPLRTDKHELIRLLRYVQEYLDDGAIGTGKLELEMLIQRLESEE